MNHRFLSFLRLSVGTVIMVATHAHAHAQAQHSAEQSDSAEARTEVIDILDPIAAQSPAVPSPAKAKCLEAAENAARDAAAGNAGQAEIVVCGERDDSAFYYSGNAEAAEDRYARETAFEGDLAKPDVAGPGIFKGPATVEGICGLLFNPCPPPKALLIDFKDLPDAPTGSDADRISQGLDPLEVEAEDDDETPRRALSEFEKRELGLPPPLRPALLEDDSDADKADAPVPTLPESSSPEAAQSANRNR